MRITYFVFTIYIDKIFILIGCAYSLSVQKISPYKLKKKLFYFLFNAEEIKIDAIYV